MVTALVTDFDRWQLDVFYAQRKKSDKISMKRERSDSREHESESKRVLSLRMYHHFERKVDFYNFDGFKSELWLHGIERPVILDFLKSCSFPFHIDSNQSESIKYYQNKLFCLKIIFQNMAKRFDIVR